MTTDRSPDRETLVGLRERVRNLTGADRDVDIAIWLLTDPKAADAYAAGKVPLPWAWCVTGSADAALALVDLVLPGSRRVLDGPDPDGAHYAIVQRDWMVPATAHHGGPASFPALALLDALLTALIEAHHE